MFLDFCCFDLIKKFEKCLHTYFLISLAEINTEKINCSCFVCSIISLQLNQKSIVFHVSLSIFIVLFLPSSDLSRKSFFALIWFQFFNDTLKVIQIELNKKSERKTKEKANDNDNVENLNDSPSCNDVSSFLNME